MLYKTLILNNNKFHNSHLIFHILIIVLFFFSCNNNLENKQIIARKIQFPDTSRITLLFDNQSQEIEYNLSDYFDMDKIERYDAEIQKFMWADVENMPDTGQILFIGSSSIRIWRSLDADMQPLETIRRGFGGATIPEAIHYSDIIIFPYKPSTIVFYCGENDHAYNNSQEIFETFQIFEKLVHQKLPECNLFFISIKPSIARSHWLRKMFTTNSMILRYCQLTDKTSYIDIANPMFDENSNLRTDIFLNDGLHMNKKGYEIWIKAIKPVLEN